MLIFVRGRVCKLNNNKPSGMQFILGMIQPSLGRFVATIRGAWKIYIS
jgi:hypothetical protein